MNVNILSHRWDWPGKSRDGIRGAGITLQVNGAPVDLLEDALDYSGETTMVETRRKGLLLQTFFEVQDGALHLHAKISNTGDSPVALGRLELLSCTRGTRIDFTGNKGMIKALCQSGWALGNKIHTLEEGKMHTGKTMGLLYAPESGSCILASFLTFDRMNTEVEYGYSRELGARMTCACDFDGFLLAPGKRICSETLYVSLGGDPFFLLRRWAEGAAGTAKPRFMERRAIGWIGSWQFKDVFSRGNYEENLLANVTAIGERLKGFGVRYVWVSIANLKDFIPGNWLLENRASFPRGLRWLSDHLAGNGMELGLWMAPFWIPDKYTSHFGEQKDQVLKYKGEYVREEKGFKFYGLGKLPPEERLGFYCRDGSHPDAQEYIKDVFTAYREMGIRYYMIDFLWAGSGSTPGAFLYDEYHDKTLVKGPGPYRSLLKVIREAAGEDTYLLSSTGPTFQNIGLVDGVRAAPDYGEGRPLIQGFAEYPGTYMQMNWNLLKTVCTNYATTFFTDRLFYHNDAFNMLTVDRPIPLNEARISTSMFGLSGGPVMLGDEIPEIDEERLRLIKCVLPQYGKNAVPLDLFHSEDYPRLYALDVETSWDHWKVLGVLNLEGENLSREIRFQDLDLLDDVEYDVFEFWDMRYMGSFREGFTANVPEYGVKVFRIAGKRAHPWVLSTDMHLTQGGMEILSVSWDDENSTLRVDCTRPAGEKGLVYLIASDQWMPVDYNRFHVTRIHGSNNLVITVPVAFEKTVESLEICFEKAFPC
ncbi:MAG: hypothetical protein R6W96_02330 [Clostridia bacterium]